MVRLSWETMAGREYDLQSSEDLTAWKSVEGFPRLASSGFEQVEYIPQERRLFFRLVYEDPVSGRFVTISEASFEMGDSFAEADPGELPVHTVSLSAYVIGKQVVTREEWQSVYQWALENGYKFANIGGGKESSHPAHSANWYDIVKWCNAKSEKEGLEPVYYLDSLKTQLYREGQVELSKDQVRWNVGGYRLPTEAEWENAARGGLDGGRFPWGNLISHDSANYWASSFPVSVPYDDSIGANFHPDFDEGAMPFTSPVSSFAPNGYGLYGMAGNVGEWCWDRYSANYYGVSSSANPRGPELGIQRVIRGGSYILPAWNCRVSDRLFSAPAAHSDNWGFRLVRTLVRE